MQNALVGDPRKNRTSHLRLTTRLRIKSNTYTLREDCERCTEDLEDVKHDTKDDDEQDSKARKNHCHCSIFQPSSGLMASIKDGQPWQRCSAAEEKERKSKKEKKVIGKLNYRQLGGEEREKRDLRKEVEKLRHQQKKKKQVEAKEKADKVNREKNKNRDDPILFTPDQREQQSKENKKKEAAKRKELLKEEREAKKARLSFLSWDM